MRITIVPLLALLFSACSGSGSTPPPPVAPAAPDVTVTVGLKQLGFAWDSVSGATHYKLLENADGDSGFTQLGEDLAASETEIITPIAVHLHDFEDALYVVQACNSTGCTGSSEVTTMSKGADAIGYFKAINADAGDGFGVGVAVSGDGTVLAVGASNEASTAVGIGGDWDDNSWPGTGAVYIYRFVDGLWEFDAYIKHTPGTDGFGAILTLNFDGTVLAVGSHDGRSFNEPALAVLLFRHNGSRWMQEAVVVPPNDEGSGVYGRKIGLSSDGSVVAVADTYSGESAGSVYIYRFDGANWTEDVQLFALTNGTTAPRNSGFGIDFSMSADANVIAVGAWKADPFNTEPNNEIGNEAGAVYLFRYESGTWQETAVIVPLVLDELEEFGWSVSLAADGRTMVVGVTGEDGSGNGVGADPSDNSSERSGAAYVFRFDGTDWAQTAYIKASNTDPGDLFGGKVVINGDGSIIAVAARNEDSGSVGVNGEQFDNSLDRAGAVYVFEFDGAEWTQVSYLKPPAVDPFDRFARSISISSDGRTLAISAGGEDGGGRGLTGNPEDNSAESSGALYVY